MNIRVLHLTFLLILISICTPKAAIATQPSHTIISGIVPEKNTKIYLLKDPANLIDSEEKAYDSAKVDASGRFIFRTKCSPASVYTMRIGERHLFIKLYCKIGDTIIIRQDSVGRFPDIVHDKGGATKFYYFFDTKFRIQQDYYAKMQEGKWQDCFKILDDRTQAQASYLMMNTYLLTDYPALKHELDDVIRFEASSDKLNLLMYLYYDDNDSVLIQDKHCLDFLNTLQFDNINHELSSVYSGFISRYLQFPCKLWRKELSKTKQLDRSERLSLRFEFCKTHLSGRSRDYGMFYCTATLFNFFSDSTALEVARKQLQDYKNDVTDIRYYNMAYSLYQTKLAMSEGKAAPNFTLPDLSSKNISLADFKGKTVYMEFTGTWCGPCRKEVPFIKELQKKCKNNPDIQFLTVWIEGATPDMWVKYVESTGLEGSHVYSKGNFAGVVPKLYKLSSVPVFMIIDKNGNVAMPSAKHPSEDGVYEELMGVVGK